MAATGRRRQEDAVEEEEVVYAAPGQTLAAAPQFQGWPRRLRAGREFGTRAGVSEARPPHVAWFLSGRGAASAPIRWGRPCLRSPPSLRTGPNSGPSFTIWGLCG